VPQGIRSAGLNFLDDPVSLNRGFLNRQGFFYKAAGCARIPAVPATLLQGVESTSLSGSACDSRQALPVSPQNCDALRKWLATKGIWHPFF